MRFSGSRVEWIGRLATGWVALMTGLASLVREFAGYYAPTHDAALWQRGNFWESVWATFIVSALLALWFYHRALVAERLKAQFPEIIGTIEEDFIHVNITRTGLSVTYIPVVVELVNHSEAEGSIKRFELTVVIEGKEYKADNKPTEGLKLTRPGFDKLGFRTNPEGVKESYKDLWKHRHEPLKRGIIQHGWLLFILTGTLIQPTRDCLLKLTVIDSFERPHPLPGMRRTRRQSGTISIPIEIDINDNRPITTSQIPIEFNERITEFIIEGAKLVGECDTLTNVTLSVQFQKKVKLWELDVESFLKEHRGASYVALFQSETGVSFNPRGLLYSRQAILSHHLKSRLKNLRTISVPTRWRLTIGE